MPHQIIVPVTKLNILTIHHCSISRAIMMKTTILAFGSYFD